MNGVRLTLLILFFVFAVLYAISNKAAFTYLRYAVLVLVSFVILTPFIWLVCAVFKDPSVMMKYTFLPPVSEWSKETLNFGNFVKLFEPKPSIHGYIYFWQYLINSLFLAAGLTCLQVFFCSMAGYALAKHNFKGKRPIMLFMLGSMMIPGVILLAPLYKLIVSIGWIDSYLALLLPGSCSVFGIFLYRQAMISVPKDLIEAGRIDGCGEFEIYLRLVMPLVRPMTGAFCLVSFLWSWNNFLSPQIFIQSQYKLTLPVVLQQYVNIYFTQYGVFLAGTLLAIIPPAILFFALQREFISGLTSGAVKG